MIKGTKMRKITKEAVNAFFSGVYYKKDNTEVKHNEGMSFFYLHGNCIATLKKDELYLSHCGWSSNTTKERMNGILSNLNIKPIYQKNWNWYYGGGILFDGNAIIKIKK